MWWYRFYQAAHIPLRIEDPEQPGSRIPNPLFQAFSVLIQILEIKNITGILRNKSIVSQKNTPKLYQFLSQVKLEKVQHIQQLNGNQKQELLQALADDFKIERGQIPSVPAKYRSRSEARMTREEAEALVTLGQAFGARSPKHELAHVKRDARLGEALDAIRVLTKRQGDTITLVRIGGREVNFYDTDQTVFAEQAVSVYFSAFGVEAKTISYDRDGVEKAIESMLKRYEDENRPFSAVKVVPGNAYDVGKFQQTYGGEDSPLDPLGIIAAQVAAEIDGRFKSYEAVRLLAFRNEKKEVVLHVYPLGSTLIRSEARGTESLEWSESDRRFLELTQEIVDEQKIKNRSVNEWTRLHREFFQFFLDDLDQEELSGSRGEEIRRIMLKNFLKPGEPETNLKQILNVVQDLSRGYAVAKQLGGRNPKWKLLEAAAGTLRVKAGLEANDEYRKSGAPLPKIDPPTNDLPLNEYIGRFNGWLVSANLKENFIFLPAFGSRYMGNQNDPFDSKALLAARQAGFESMYRSYPEFATLLVENGVKYISFLPPDPKIHSPPALLIHFARPFAEDAAKRTYSAIAVAIAKVPLPQFPEMADESSLVEYSENEIRSLAFEKTVPIQEKIQKTERLFELALSGRLIPRLNLAHFSKEGIKRLADRMGRTDAEREAIQRDLELTVEKESKDEKDPFYRETPPESFQQILKERFEMRKSLMESLAGFAAPVESTYVAGARQRMETIQHKKGLLALAQTQLFRPLVHLLFETDSTGRWMISDQDAGNLAKQLEKMAPLLLGSAAQIEKIMSGLPKEPARDFFAVQFLLHVFRGIGFKPRMPFKDDIKTKDKIKTMEWYENVLLKTTVREYDIYINPELLANAETFNEKVTALREEMASIQNAMWRDAVDNFDEKRAEKMEKDLSRLRDLAQMTDQTVVFSLHERAPPFSLSTSEKLANNAKVLADWIRQEIKPEEAAKTDIILFESLLNLRRSVENKTDIETLKIGKQILQKAPDHSSELLAFLKPIAETRVLEILEETAKARSEADKKRLHSRFLELKPLVETFPDLVEEMAKVENEIFPRHVASANQILTKYAKELALNENRTIFSFVRATANNEPYPKLQKLENHLRHQRGVLHGLSLEVLQLIGELPAHLRSEARSAQLETSSFERSAENKDFRRPRSLLGLSTLVDNRSEARGGEEEILEMQEQIMDFLREHIIRTLQSINTVEGDTDDFEKSDKRRKELLSLFDQEMEKLKELISLANERELDEVKQIFETLDRFKNSALNGTLEYASYNHPLLEIYAAIQKLTFPSEQVEKRILSESELLKLAERKSKMEASALIQEKNRRLEKLVWEWKLSHDEAKRFEKIDLDTLIRRREMLKQIFSRHYEDAHFYFEPLEHPELLLLQLNEEVIERLRLALSFEAQLEAEIGKQGLAIQGPFVKKIDEDEDAPLWANFEAELKREKSSPKKAGPKPSQQIKALERKAVLSLRNWFTGKENKMPETAVLREISLSGKNRAYLNVFTRPNSKRAVRFTMNSAYLLDESGKHREVWLKAGQNREKKFLTIHMRPNGPPVGRATWNPRKRKFERFQGPLFSIGNRDPEKRRFTRWANDPLDRGRLKSRFWVMKQGSSGKLHIFDIELPDRPRYASVDHYLFERGEDFEVETVPLNTEKRILVHVTEGKVKGKTRPAHTIVRYYHPKEGFLLSPKFELLYRFNHWRDRAPDPMVSIMGAESLLLLSDEDSRGPLQIRLGLARARKGRRVFITFEQGEKEEKILNIYALDENGLPRELIWRGHHDEFKNKMVLFKNFEPYRLKGEERFRVQLEAWRLEYVKHGQRPAHPSEEEYIEVPAPKIWEAKEIALDDIRGNRKIIAELISDPKFDFSAAAKENKLPQLKGRWLGKTDPQGQINLAPFGNYRFNWAVLGVGETGWKLEIIKSSFTDGLFQFTVQFRKKNKSTFYRTFQIGPETRAVPGSRRERGKTREVLMLKVVDETERFKYILDDQFILSSDDNLIPVLQYIGRDAEIPKSRQRLKPRKVASGGVIHIGMIGSANDIASRKAMTVDATSHFTGKTVVPIVRKSGNQEYEIGVEAVSPFTNEPLIVSSYIFSRNREIILQNRERSNWQVDGKIPAQKLPQLLHSQLIREIMFGIIKGNLHEKLRTFKGAELKQSGFIQKAGTALYFWEPDVRFELPPFLPLNSLMLKIDPAPDFAKDAWAASLYVDEQIRETKGKIQITRPAVFFKDIVLFANGEITKKRPFPSARTHFKHVKGDIPKVKKVYWTRYANDPAAQKKIVRDSLQALWVRQWLANGGPDVPNNQYVQVQYGRTNLFLSLARSLYEFKLGSEFNGRTHVSWMEFPEIAPDARGARFYNSKTRSKRFIVFFKNNQFIVGGEPVSRSEARAKNLLSSVLSAEFVQKTALWFVFTYYARFHISTQAKNIDRKTTDRVLREIRRRTPVGREIKNISEFREFLDRGWAEAWRKTWKEEADREQDTARKTALLYLAMDNEELHTPEYWEIYDELRQIFPKSIEKSFENEGLPVPPVKVIWIPNPYQRKPIRAILVGEGPLSIVLHGMSTTKEQPMQQSLVKKLVSQGNAVLLIDFPGHGENLDILLTPKGINDFWETIFNYFDGTKKTEIGAKLKVDGNRISLFGYSFGGNLALRTALNGKFRKRVNAVMLMNAPVNRSFVTKMKTWLRHGAPYYRHIFKTDDPAEQRALLENLKISEEELDQIPIAFRHRIRFFFGGRRDFLISTQEPKWLAHFYEAANLMPELFITVYSGFLGLFGEGHYYLKRKEEAFAEIGNFMIRVTRAESALQALRENRNWFHPIAKQELKELTLTIDNLRLEKAHGEIEELVSALQEKRQELKKKKLTAQGEALEEIKAEMELLTATIKKLNNIDVILFPYEAPEEPRSYHELAWPLRLFYQILFPLVKRYLVSVTGQGLEHLPQEGSGFLFSNHNSLFDGLFLTGDIAEKTLKLNHGRGRVLGFLANTEDLGPTQRFLIQYGAGIEIKEGETKSIIQKHKQKGRILGAFPTGIASKDAKFVLENWDPNLINRARELGMKVIPTAVWGTYPRKFPRNSKELNEVLRMFVSPKEYKWLNQKPPSFHFMEPKTYPLFWRWAKHDVSRAFFQAHRLLALFRTSPPFQFHYEILEPIDTRGKTTEQVMEEIQQAIGETLNGKKINGVTVLLSPSRSEVRQGPVPFEDEDDFDTLARVVELNIRNLGELIFSEENSTDGVVRKNIGTMKNDFGVLKTQATSLAAKTNPSDEKQKRRLLTVYKNLEIMEKKIEALRRRGEKNDGKKGPDSYRSELRLAPVPITPAAVAVTMNLLSGIFPVGTPVTLLNQMGIRTAKPEGLIPDNIKQKLGIPLDPNERNAFGVSVIPFSGDAGSLEYLIDTTIPVLSEYPNKFAFIAVNKKMDTSEIDKLNQTILKIKSVGGRLAIIQTNGKEYSEILLNFLKQNRLSHPAFVEIYLTLNRLAKQAGVKKLNTFDSASVIGSPEAIGLENQLSLINWRLLTGKVSGKVGTFDELRALAVLSVRTAGEQSRENPELLKAEWIRNNLNILESRNRFVAALKENAEILGQLLTLMRLSGELLAQAA